MTSARPLPSPVGLLARLVAIALSAALLAVPARAASVLTDWLEPAVRAADHVAPEPTAGSRFFAVLYTATYDAWAAYDARAVGVASGAELRATGGPSTVLARREAVSQAAYLALVSLAPSHRRHFDAFMAEQGYDPLSESAPAVLGRRAAAAVLALRRFDGANQAGSYDDVSMYVPAAGDVSRWQPLPVQGMAQVPITPHWPAVVPFGLRRADQFRPPPPPARGSAAFDAQVDSVLALSAGLTDRHKATAEYWAPFGSHPASHLMELTEWVSLRDDLDLDGDVRLFFAVANAVFDAGVASWDAKYHYDYVRPTTAIRALGDRPVTAWRPPSRRTQRHLPNEGAALAFGDDAYAEAATVTLPADEWEPYLPTPPFPEYVSGHSAFTAAWARALALATGDDRFGFEAEWPYLFVEGRRLAAPVRLRYNTFWDAAEASGRSRLWGGIHWPVGNTEGLRLGAAAASQSWATAQMYLTGQARPLGAAVAFIGGSAWQTATDGAARLADGTVTFAGPGSGQWTTRRLDPPPACPYELEAAVETVGDAAARVVLLDARTDAVLARADVADGTARLAFEADGETPIRLVVEAEGTSGSARPAHLFLRAARYEVPETGASAVPYERSVFLGPSRLIDRRR